MDATDVAQSYFDAWNRRDPDAIVATFAEGGTYTDPNVPEGLRDRAIGEYAAGLFTAFPDLSFDIISPHATGDGGRPVANAWDQHRSFEGEPADRCHRGPARRGLHRGGGRQSPLRRWIFRPKSLRRAARAAGDRAAPLRWTVLLRLQRSHPVGQAHEAPGRWPHLDTGSLRGRGRARAGVQSCRRG